MLAGVFLLFVAFLATVEFRFPHWTDREYAARRNRVLTSRAEHPDRPVLAVIGGSRVGTGFLPEALRSMTDSNGKQVTVLNFSHLGAGPRMNLLQLHRLLRDGVLPERLILEVVPAHLASEITTIADLSFRDICVLRPHWADKRLLINPVKTRGKSPLRYRNGLLDEFAPAFATGPALNLDRYGGNPRWLESSPRATGDRTDLYREIRWQYQGRMANWRIDPELDATMREFLCVCETRRIPVALTLFPETSEFRSWYGNGVEERILSYFASIREEYDLPVFDCRNWMPDDAFHDPHHLTPAGAKSFSRRFAEEILEGLASHSP